jgi:flagellar hook-associated protein 2
MTTTSSATSSATSSLVASLGGGSGVDMTALANNLAVAQFAGKTDRLTNQSDTLDKQISAASNLKGMLSTLSSSLGDRVRTGDLSPQPQVANTAVASGTLSGTTRPTGTYSLEVTHLASTQTLASPAFAASTSTVGAGTLTIRFGTVGAGSFSEDTAHPAVAVTIPTGATLAETADAINGAGAGITAYVANTAEGAKLVLKGQEGAANGFVVEAAPDPADPAAASLAALAWEPATGAPVRLLAGASDAAFKIDGLAMTAPTNAVTDAVPGLNLTLTGTNPGSPTKITFADTSSAITATMQDLVTVLNEVAGDLATATNPQTGDLARDGGAQALKRALAALGTTVVMPGAPEGTPRTLGDLGLSVQRDGTFTLDTKRLADTLKANPQAAGAMFTTGLYGVYGTIDGIVRKATSASDPGSLAGSIARYTTQKTTIAATKTKLADQQETLRTTLVARFAAADSRIGASKSTLSFLQNQIAAWNKSDN